MKSSRKVFGRDFEISLVSASVLLIFLFLTSLAVAQQSFDGEFKVGIIGPLSGPAKVWGQDISRGVNLAIEEINANGGLDVGGKKYKAAVIEFDDKYQGTEGTSAANKLVFQDKVKYIFGSISSASILAFQVITEPNNVLCLVNSFSKQVLSPEKPYTFRILMTSNEKAKFEVNAIFDRFPTIKTVATFAPQDVSGTSVTEDYVDAVGSKAKVVIKEYFQRGAEDFYPMITRIKQTQPDLIISCGSPPASVAKFLKQARQLGIKGPIMGHSGSVENPIAFVEIAEKENTNNYYYGVDFDISTPDPKAQKFQQRYKEKFGEANYGYVAPAFYDAMGALAYAIQKSGSFDTEKVKNFFETKMSEYVGVMGPFNFAGKDSYGIDHQRLTNCYFCTFENGKHTILKQLR
ncbi:MAG: ABC transporter substrate-binding protein [Deltaproteobacteria bacterium]|nr:ABC transporter substrate-binding protein [Deltaproteobacteria bacterium]